MLDSHREALAGNFVCTRPYIGASIFRLLMNRRRIVHIQIVLLAVLALLVFLQAFGPGVRTSGDVVFEGIDPHELRRQAFVLEAPAELHIRATGSLGSADDTLFAAHAWILDASSRRPAWRMRPEARRSGERIVRFDTTLTLAGGTYIAHYASHGPSLTQRRSRSFLDRIFRSDDDWTADASEWEFVIEGGSEGGIEGSGDADIRTVSLDDARDDEHVIWTTGAVGNRASVRAWLLVDDTVRTHVYTVGEIADEVSDFGWIRQANDSIQTWTFTDGESIWAGGAPSNRLFEGWMDLVPGIYEVGYQSDARHAYDAWRANPPFDPDGWGMALSANDPQVRDAVRMFDPWEHARSVVELTAVGNDEERSATLRVEEDVEVVIYTLGEIGRTRYDYGSLVDVDRYQTTWEMTDERSTEAGGHRNNRREIALRTLQPGSYRLEYRTDGSHAYGDWRNGRPDNPERWGVSLFTLDSTAAARVTVLDTVATGTPPGSPPPPSPPAPADGNVLLEATSMGSDQRIRREFRLDEETSLQIRALGEITLVNRFDYGWIERADNGAIAWEMTYGNTVHAGGDSRNRMFNGAVTLPSGDYVAHYVTDFSHAYGDFRSEEVQPTDPSAWGIIIQRR